MDLKICAYFVMPQISVLPTIWISKSGGSVDLADIFIYIYIYFISESVDLWI